MQLGYREVESMFAARFGIPEERHIAFRGRLDHLRKLGCPAGVNSGRGRPATFSWHQIVELGLALDLIHVGLPPDAVSRILHGERITILLHIKDMFNGVSEDQLMALLSGRNWPIDSTLFMGIRSFAMNSLKPGGESETYLVDFIPGGALASQLDGDEGYETPLVLLNLGTRLLNLLEVISAWAEIELPKAVEQFRDWIVTESDSAVERMLHDLNS